jgi:hypothetical protein
MKQQPDKLFQEKLSQFSKPAPASAWDRIESGAQKRPFPYYKVAAAASVVLACVIWYSLRTETGAENTLSEKTTTSTPAPNIEAPAKESVQSNPPIAVQTEPEVKKEKSIRAAESTTRYTGPKEIAPVTLEVSIDSALPIEDVTNHSMPVAEATPQVQIDEPAVAPETVVPEKENVVIIFSAEETKEYLTKNSEGKATSEKKTTSTLKKVWSKAKDLKDNQSPLGDLRQMKDELLALNFKSDKQRGQKK